MENNKNADALLYKLFDDQKNQMFNLMENTQCGMRKALFLMYLNTGPLCAADVGYSLGISMARTTVLLQKLEKKNFITKEIDLADKRKTYLKLTKEGINEVENHKNRIYAILNHLIDTIGYEKLDNFIDLLKMINNKIEEYGEV